MTALRKNCFNHTDYGQASDWLDAGNLLAYPTEAVWGIGCDPFNEQAVKKLLALKDRPIEKGLIVITPSDFYVREFLVELPLEQQNIITESWHNPSNQATTWLFPILSNLKTPIPNWITGNHPSLAIRSIEPLKPISVLCQSFDHSKNPYHFLVSTSCNPSGQPPATTLEQAQSYFANYPHVGYFNATTLGYTKPSQIKDALTGELMRL